MNDTYSNDTSLKNMAGVLIPLMLLLTGKRDMGLKLDFNNNLQDKVDMLSQISRYFSENEQVILYRVQDILDIFNKLNRAKDLSYTPEVKAEAVEMSRVDKREKIMREIRNYLDDANREKLDKVLEIKSKIDTTKSKLENYQAKANTEETKSMDSLLELITCFKPVLSEKPNNKIEKLEEIVDIIKKPE